MALLNSRYTFDHFIVGEANELAVAAASAVASSPGRAYNPLFIFGATGLGKTHLMQAVAHELAAQRGSRVCYETADEFLVRCLAEISKGEVAAFRATYDGVDALLIDDVHALAKRVDVQAEFADVFSAVTARGGQVMLTSDRAPGQIGVEAALVRRFALGKVVQLGTPSWEHRLAILQAFAASQQLDGELSREVLECIAAHVTTNVRALEGAVTRVVAHARLGGTAPTATMTEELLRAFTGGTGRVGGSTAGGAASPIEIIVRTVAAEWNTTADTIQGGSRTKRATEPRHVAMYLSRDLLDLPLGEIGRRFGGRDHTTVMHAVRRVTEQMTQDAGFRRRIGAVRATLAPAVGAEATEQRAAS